jgi:hypothetical protein
MYMEIRLRYRNRLMDQQAQQEAAS